MNSTHRQFLFSLLERKNQTVTNVVNHLLVLDDFHFKQKPLTVTQKKEILQVCEDASKLHRKQILDEEFDGHELLYTIFEYAASGLIEGKIAPNKHSVFEPIRRACLEELYDAKNYKLFLSAVVNSLEHEISRVQKIAKTSLALEPAILEPQY